MADPEQHAADLLERLLTDAAFRARFRREPVQASLEHGLPELAEQLRGTGRALWTLEQRESRSSLAGVVLAAAAEGVSLGALVQRAEGAGGATAQAVEVALSRTGLGTVPPAHAASPGPGVAGTGDEPPLDPAEAARHAGTPVAGVVADGPAAPPRAPAPEHQAADDDAVTARREPAGDATAGGPEAWRRVLNDPRLELPPAAREDLASSEIDPRLLGVLAHLVRHHEVGLSVVKTGHDRLSASGNVSNHFHGRGLDIATVDGEPVRPTSAAARELVDVLRRMRGVLRPSEMGTPWEIDEPGFFSDGGHQDHVHVAFDDPPPEDLRVAAHDAPAPEPAPPGRPDPAADHHEHAHDQHAHHERPSPPGTATFSAVVGSDEAPSPSSEPSASAPPADPVRPGEPAAAAQDVGAGYPGDDAPREQLAAWMGRAAERAGLPPELPVMAALVESELQNLGGGDRDSVGFFQMRTGIWDTGAYAGYPDRPALQLKWFVDRAVEVKQARGRGFGGDPATWGEWIADVERPAAQYRGRYQPRLDEARALLRETGPRPADPADVAAPARAEALAQAPAPEPERGRTPGDPSRGPGTARFRAVVGRNDAQVLKAVVPEQPAPPHAVTASDDASAPTGGVTEYPGDAAPPTAVAAWMADHARAAGLPPELPVMAALVESGLRNLPSGDRDSVGLFQMRLQFWNRGPYAGYPDRPELQLRWFIDRALEERREHAGDPGYARAPDRLGEWAADVEQCAEDLRWKYQAQLGAARRLLGEQR